MHDKDPTTWSLATWLLALGMSSAGGFANWYARVRQSQIRAFNLAELLCEILTSAFVGVGAFMAAHAFDQPLGLCAALAGLGGNLATRVLIAAEQWLEHRFKTYLKGKK